jgi:ABC-type uncharacterized transport system auxiliary subunit
MLSPRSIVRFAGALPLLIAGCTSFLEGEPASTFPLRAGGGPAVQVAASLPASERVAVAVERPIASGAIASDRLVVEVGDQLRFVAGARWEDDLPTLVGADIARALLATEGVEVVDAAQRGGRADFALITAIERMQVQLGEDYSGRAVTEIVARLVRLPAREIVATSVFRAEAPAADDAPDTLARAIGTATQEALGDMAGWVAAQTR